MFVHVFAIARLMKEKKRKEKKKRILRILLVFNPLLIRDIGKYFSFAVVGGEQSYCFVKESLGSFVSSYLPRIANRFGRDVIGNKLCVTNNESFKQVLCLVFFSITFCR